MRKTIRHLTSLEMSAGFASGKAKQGEKRDGKQASRLADHRNGKLRKTRAQPSEIREGKGELGFHRPFASRRQSSLWPFKFSRHGARAEGERHQAT